MALRQRHILFMVAYCIVVANLLGIGHCTLPDLPGHEGKLEIILRLRGEGSQLYRCTITNSIDGGKPTWTSVGSRADLFPVEDASKNLAAPGDSIKRVGWHYFLTSPDSEGAQATWKCSYPPQKTAIESNSNPHSAGTDVKSGKLPSESLTASSTARDAAHVDPDSGSVTGKIIFSIPSHNKDDLNSLLLEATEHTGSGTLSIASYIQRTIVKGGAAPIRAQCTRDGELVSVPYESVYVFWGDPKVLTHE